MTCECMLVNTRRVAPGWGCCKCRTYNGLQRKRCRICGHAPDWKRVELKVPHYWVQCGKCGSASRRDELPTLTLAGRRIREGSCPVMGCDGVLA